MPLDFWQKLKKTGRPILALAPMAGFSDSAFRQICRSYGADVLYSEMISAAALFYNPRLKNNKTLALAAFNRQKERPYVVQLFGCDPEHFAAATKVIAAKIKPDGIDINFGCPVPKVARQGAGSGLMKNLKQSRAVIKAVLDNTDLPVSVKIRARAGEVGSKEFFKNIADLPVAAAMIHCRTLNEGFSGQPDWSIAKLARPYFQGVILVNGGLNDLADARQALQDSGADGLGLARGVLGRPWLFKEIGTGREMKLSRRQIFSSIMKHAALAQKLKGKSGILELRAHLTHYVSGLAGAAKLREKLVKAASTADIKKILK